MTALLSPQHGLRRDLARCMQKFREELAECGTMSVLTSHTRRKGLDLSTACDTGGKEGNQDFVATLVPQQPFPMRWAVAVADGVSSSLDSEQGSQLACLTALRTLKRSYEYEPRRYSPVAVALNKYRTIGEQIGNKPDEYRPEGCSRFAWNFARREGKVLESTLLVAWETRRGIRIEGIGDGGFILETEDGNPPLAHLPASDRPVRCLGPNNSQRYADFYFGFSKWSRLCLFTDGLTQLVPRWYPRLQEALEEPKARGGNGPASDVLDETIRVDGDLLEDNVTLACVSKERR